MYLRVEGKKLEGGGGGGGVVGSPQKRSSVQLDFHHASSKQPSVHLLS